MRLWLWAAAWAGLVLAMACDGRGTLSVKNDPPKTQATPGQLTWFKDVEPIVQSRCANCHEAGGIAPFPLQTYDDVASRGALVTASVQRRAMPPWPPARGHHPLLFDRSLSDEQIATVQHWVEGGMPEGDPADHRSIVRDDPKIRADATLKMGETYTPPAGADDDYRCFLLDPGLSVDRFITGYEVQPGLKAMAHHVVLYAVPVAGDALSKVQQADATDPGPGYRCEGGPGVELPDNMPQIRMLGSWKPGSTAVPLPAGTGLKLAAGEKILLQMHYAMLTARGPDQSTVLLQFADKPVSEATLVTVRNLTFQVPAGHDNVEVTQDEVFTKPSRVFALFPHMHYLGKSAEVSRVHGVQSEVLIEIPKWQFPWQGDYLLETPVEFAPGDKLHLRCVFDNTAANQPVVHGQKQEPRTVGWGDGALDEMCLVYVYQVGAP